MAKRHGALFLDDCYKRMSFACQAFSSSSSPDNEIGHQGSNGKTSNDTQNEPVKIEMVVVSGTSSSSGGLGVEISSTATTITAAIAAADLNDDQRVKILGATTSSDSSKLFHLHSFKLVNRK